MVSYTFVAALGALPLAFAQSTSSGNDNTSASSSYTAASTAISSATPTGTGTASKQTVAVGKDDLKFTPDTIKASVGDEITFEFYPKNHSVVQAAFNDPCNPSDNGIFSGFIASSSGEADKAFTITVNDTKPIWLYCATLKPSPHCAAGMVAVINAPSSGPNTLDAFRKAAVKTNTSTAPDAVSGGIVETSSNGTSPTGGTTGTTTGTPKPTGAAPSLIINSGLVAGVAFLFAGLLL
ncbi:Cupredoxin [Lophiostoma macrostomum CBS 122681]|uniref:Cupredoxin n=1 Tax=Lophiostoma macrostomum CBS 122681 TaxID=1314788 RepID=A0A6A6SSX0_9PLEO|nr:Cupredoxin [Lophiostoma macrostomum CBS 122681]